MTRFFPWQFPDISMTFSEIPDITVTVFNLVFSLLTFYDCCNASRSGFVYRGALNTRTVFVIVIVISLTSV